MFQISAFKKISLAALIASLISLSGCASSGTSSSNAGATPRASEKAEYLSVINRIRSEATRTGEVYLMRGLLNVFSRGMDVMAAEMRGKGLDAVSFNHSDWQPIAYDIVARAKSGNISYPIVIMGHSLGGNEAPNMANYLGSQSIKVAFVVTFDPTERRSVGKNVGTVINYYLPNGENTISRGADFIGKLSNVNVSSIPDIKHTNVEKNAKLQARSIETVMNITKPLRKKRWKRSNRTS